MPDSSTEPDREHFDDFARPVYGASFAERWTVWRRDPRLITTALVLVALAAGMWWIRASGGTSSGTPADTSAQHGTTATTDAYAAPTTAHAVTTTIAVFVVDVVGAVRHPGVVSLPGSARVIDALNAAGGVFANADLARINLAAHLVDGMRIAVPRRGEAADPAAPTGDTGGGATDAGGPPTPSTPLDLNAATEAQLEALPGIGPSLAQAIIQERDHEGGFHTVDDLRRVHGIGDVRFAQLRPLVTV